jgi:methyl-accepting chemotaxis protein
MSMSTGPGKLVESATTVSSAASEQIREGLAHAGQQLADKVQSLAHKGDAASGVTGKWQDMQDTAHATIGQVTRGFQEGTQAVQDKAAEVTGQVKKVTNQARAQVPAPVRRRVTQVTGAVRQRPAPAAAMVFAVLVLLLLRRLFRTAE